MPDRPPSVTDPRPVLKARPLAALTVNTASSAASEWLSWRIPALTMVLAGTLFDAVKTKVPPPKFKGRFFAADGAAERQGVAGGVGPRLGIPQTTLALPTPFNMGGVDEYVLLDDLEVVARVHALAAFEFLNGFSAS